jgi:hypothetical protein
MSIKIPDIPSLSAQTSTEVRRAFDSIRSFMRELRGSGGVVTPAPSAGYCGLLNTGTGSKAPPWLPLPAAIEDFTATGAFNSILLSWTAPPGLAYVEVWRSETDVIGEAVLLGTSVASMLTDVPPDSKLSKTYYYWVRGVNGNGEVGPWNATEGTPASTADDPEYMLEVLTGEIKSSHLFATLNSRIDLIDAPESGLTVSTDDFAFATLADILKQDQLHEHRRLQNSINDATIEIDPASGTISLKATANVTTDIEARVRGVELSMDAVAGSIGAATYDIEILEGSVAGHETRIEQVEGEISLKASSAYVDSRVDGITLMAENTSAEEGVIIPETLGWLALVMDKIADFTWRNQGSLAVAQTDILTQADAVSATAAIVDTLATKVDDNFAVVLQEIEARTTSDSAEAAARQDLTAYIAQNTAAIMAESSIRATADSSEAQTRTNMFTAHGMALDDLDEAAVAAIMSGVLNTDQSREMSLAFAQEQTTLLSTALEAEAAHRLQLAALVNANSATLSSEMSTRATADSAEALARETLATTVGENTAAVEVLSSSVDGVLAQHTIKTQVRTSDGKDVIAGIGLMADVEGNSEILMMADRFAIVPTDLSSSDKLAPFVVGTFMDPILGVERYGVFMNGAYVVNLTAKNFVSQTIKADTVRAGISIDAPVINGGEVNIGNFRLSTGSSSLRVNAGASTLFFVDTTGNAFFKGNITGSSGVFAGTLAAGVIDQSSFDPLPVGPFTSPGVTNTTVPTRAGWGANIMCKAIIVGAGGGGGGGYARGADNANPACSGGGGGAGTRMEFVFPVTVGAAISITIGSGGSGGASSVADWGVAGNGTSGGLTKVAYAGTDYAATSGSGGTGGSKAYANAATTVWVGDESGSYSYAFGAPPGGTLGGAAGTGARSGFPAPYNNMPGGQGGSTFLSAGASGGITGSVGSSGVLGTGTGGGGGGAICYTNTETVGYGGSGASGYVLLEFYDPNTVVLNKRYSALVNWLDANLGTVPTDAR